MLRYLLCCLFFLVGFAHFCVSDSSECQATAPIQKTVVHCQPNGQSIVRCIFLILSYRQNYAQIFSFFIYSYFASRIANQNVCMWFICTQNESGTLVVTCSY